MAASRLSKGPLTPLLKRFRWFPLAEPEKYGGSYLKNAWKDAPNVSRSFYIDSQIGTSVVDLADNQND